MLRTEALDTPDNTDIKIGSFVHKEPSIFKIYSNPIDKEGNRAIDFRCKFCSSSPSYLLGIYIDFGGDAGTILICKSCLLAGVFKINRAYIGKGG